MLNEATFVVFGVVRKVEQGGNGREMAAADDPR